MDTFAPFDTYVIFINSVSFEVVRAIVHFSSRFSCYYIEPDRRRKIMKKLYCDSVSQLYILSGLSGTNKVLWHWPTAFRTKIPLEYILPIEDFKEVV